MNDVFLYLLLNPFITNIITNNMNENKIIFHVF